MRNLFRHHFILARAKGQWYVYELLNGYTAYYPASYSVSFERRHYIGEYSLLQVHQACEQASLQGGPYNIVSDNCKHWTERVMSNLTGMFIRLYTARCDWENKIYSAVVWAVKMLFDLVRFKALQWPTTL